MIEKLVLKRYALFAEDDGSEDQRGRVNADRWRTDEIPRGWNLFVGSFDTLEEIYKVLARWRGCEWWQIVDLETGEIVEADYP